jgi:hypothetical protein
MQLSSTGRIC